MQKLRPALRSGQHVIVRDEPWLVVHSEAFQDASLVTLRGVSAGNLGETLRVLAPFDRVHAGRTRAPLRRGTRRDAFLAAAAAIADGPRWSDTWTAASAGIDLRPWQLEPALAAIRGTMRLLLADAVGLGKTIQALLIVNELVARGLSRRVLVLTPASLREQWAGEASQRFGLTATIFDHATLASAASALPIGINPWSTASLIVSSIDLVKRGDVRASLDAVPFDVLIVDEAHHLTPATDRAAVIADLAARTPWLVLLSATPHTGDDSAFRFLCELGDVEGAGEIKSFRRLSEEVNVCLGSRRQKSIAVSTTPAERALLDETVAYARAVWSRSAEASGSSLVAAVIARRAASCPIAAQRTLERRLALLAGANPSPDTQPALPWDEGDEDDGPDDASLAVAGLDDRSREIAWLERLVLLAAAASARSSKVDVIRRLLQRTHEPLIVFSEYREVVRTVTARIADLSTVAVLHGGLSAAERRHQLAAFTQGRARTLVTTDAAGEGLNLQARCRLVVNLELPWNPLKLEQRIGRVDRLGQKRRVHAIQLLHRQSFEEVVAARFEERRSRAAAATSPSTQPIPPERIAALVLGDALDLACDVEPRPRPVPETGGEWAIRSRRLGTVARSGGTSTWPVRSVCAEWQATPRETRAVFVFATDVVDQAHRLVERQITALKVELRAEAFDRGRSVVDVLARAALDQRIRAAVDAHVALEFEHLHIALAQAAEKYERRVDALLRAIERQRICRPIQTSLFDRREEQRSQLRDTAIEGWIRNLQRHRESALAMRVVAHAAPHLVAAWSE